MSEQAGIWNFDGQPISRQLLTSISEALKAKGPDGEYLHVDTSIALLYRPFHTTAESREETQPYRSSRGFIVTWDGRLDNRSELIPKVRDYLGTDTADVAVVAAAFECWGTDSLERLIGDWALCVWNPVERELILACDYMSLRHIFYQMTPKCICWTSDLTPLVLLSRDRFHVDENYIAGYLVNDPDSHLTPYREVRQVPAGHFVRVREGWCMHQRYWFFSSKSSVRYRTDAEYEDHFRHAFRQSVRRRLRSDTPVLGELSGGLDSSSIICMADDILAKEKTQTPRLDTLSFYDKTEPKGDDWIYFQKIEQKRGRAGKHIDISTYGMSSFFDHADFAPSPGRLEGCHAIEDDRAVFFREGGYRVVLSGIGGDEFLGGIPDPSALLADLAVQFRLLRLAKDLIAWSLIKRKPWIQLLGVALANLIPASIAQHFAKENKEEDWFPRPFAKRTRMVIRKMDVDEHFGLWMPSRRSCIGGVLMMANKLSHRHSRSTPPEEYRYPYLDQTLIEFILSIPASQLLRPGERRSLMRRALAGIVPDEVLHRSTKQLAARTLIATLSPNWQALVAAFDSSLSSRLGFVDSARFMRALQTAKAGGKIHIVRMLKTIALESWLRDLTSRRLLEVNSAAHLEIVAEAMEASR